MLPSHRERSYQRIFRVVIMLFGRGSLSHSKVVHPTACTSSGDTAETFFPNSPVRDTLGRSRKNRPYVIRIHAERDMSSILISILKMRTSSCCKELGGRHGERFNQQHCKLWRLVLHTLSRKMPHFGFSRHGQSLRPRLGRSHRLRDAKL